MPYFQQHFFCLQSVTRPLAFLSLYFERHAPYGKQLGLASFQFASSYQKVFAWYDQSKIIPSVFQTSCNYDNLKLARVYLPRYLEL